jgi:hypothetical protein
MNLTKAQFLALIEPINGNVQSAAAKMHALTRGWEMIPDHERFPVDKEAIRLLEERAQQLSNLADSLYADLADMVSARVHGSAPDA